MSSKPIRIVLMGYEGVQTLDLAGPMDAFGAVNFVRPHAYSICMASLDGRPFSSEAGLRMTPGCALDELERIDTLIVPGGASLRNPGCGTPISEAVRRRSSECRRIVSVCTGLYGVAPAGLLDGRRVTTHWRFAADAAARFPALSLECDKIFIKDGRFYTSAGITAAIDLSLALIEEDFGPQMALTVARDLVVYVRRSGGQLQYSEPLRFQARADNRFADLAVWIASHLDADLSVERLAARTGLSERQFNRRFTQTFGRSPSRQIEALRLDAARDYLTATAARVETIAATIGFKSDDAFRRAFDRRFGLSPSEYRSRFSTN